MPPFAWSNYEYAECYVRRQSLEYHLLCHTTRPAGEDDGWEWQDKNSDTAQFGLGCRRTISKFQFFLFWGFIVRIMIDFTYVFAVLSTLKAKTEFKNVVIN